MAESMANTRQMLSMVVAAANGMLEEGQQVALKAQVMGAFASSPVVGANIVRLAKSRDWDGLVGAIGAYIDVQEAASSATHASLTNYSPVINKNVSSSVSSSDTSLVQQFERTMTAIEYSDSLTPAEKAIVVESVENAKRAAESGDHSKVASNLSKALDLASKGIGTAKAVLELVPLVLSLMA